MKFSYGTSGGTAWSTNGEKPPSATSLGTLASTSASISAFE